MPSKALDVLSEALDRERVTSISVLSGPSNITPKAKKAFQRFKTEMTNDGIACEWRVLSSCRKPRFTPGCSSTISSLSSCRR